MIPVHPFPPIVQWNGIMCALICPPNVSMDNMVWDGTSPSGCPTAMLYNPRSHAYTHSPGTPASVELSQPIPS